MLRNVTTLIFDLDGTISDPSLGIIHCINYALAAHGFPEVSADIVAAEIGPPLDETFQRLQPTADQAMILSLVAKYRKRYAESGYAENKIYPDIQQEIQALYSQGIRLGICTSKRRDFAEKILQLFDLHKYFSFVDGGDIGVKKAQQLEQLLMSKVIDPQAVMVGDRNVDILAAKANGLRSVAVLWGFGSSKELTAASPTMVLSKVSEIGRLAV